MVTTSIAITDDVAPQLYAVLHVPRPVVDGGPERGGGVAVVFRQSVVVRRHPLTNKCRPKTFELQLVRVGTSPLTHTVANIYQPQWMSSVAEFVDELTDIIALLSAECTDNIIVCGDLNCLGPAPEQVDVRHAAAFESLGLSQLVSAATREDSLLDVLATSSPALLSGVDVDDAGQISDHRLVTARLVVHNPKPPVAVKWRRLRV